MSNEEAKPDVRRVFVIYGHNLAAYHALVQFLRALGLRPWSFDELSNELGGSPYVEEIVREGMRRSHAILALFTPDEWAGARLPGEPAAWRTQSRPNVIFEAGLALALAPDRTVLVSLGTDVELFSDIRGRHVVKLGNSLASRSNLRDKLVKIGCEIDGGQDWTDPSRGGDFDGALPAAGAPPLPADAAPAFDELAVLREKLRGRPISDVSSESLFNVLERVAVKVPDWTNATTEQLMEEIDDIVNRDKVVDDIYWWLIVYGVIRFKNIKQWWGKDDDWRSSMKFTKLADRGIALLNQLRSSA
jgi:hypothetical protein